MIPNSAAGLAIWAALGMFIVYASSRMIDDDDKE